MSISKTFTILSALLVLTIPVALAQSQSNDVGPGMVGADSPIYGLEVAWDNAAVTVGLKNAGKVTQERASEAKEAISKNKTDAALKAVENAQKMANKSKAGDEEGVQRAMNSLQDTMTKMQERIQNAPNENAREGMQTALENMQGAVNNMEMAKENREKARAQRNNSNTGPQDRGPDTNPGDDQVMDRQQDRTDQMENMTDGENQNMNTSSETDQNTIVERRPNSDMSR